jgi:hypothetical protein
MRESGAIQGKKEQKKSSIYHDSAEYYVIYNFSHYLPIMKNLSRHVQFS